MDMKERMVIPIVLLCHNNAKQLGRCVDSIRAATRYPYALHIVDNASTDAALVKLLAEYEAAGDVTVWREGRNRWVLGLNRCLSELEKGAPPYYVVSDADIVFPELDSRCWLETLIGCMDEYPFLGKLGIGLSLANIENKPHMQGVLARERLYSSISLTPEVYLALVDTTAAIYRPDIFAWNKFRFYPGHGSAMKPYYYSGRHKAVLGYHLGWDTDEYAQDVSAARRDINEKVICFAKYAGSVDALTLRSASSAAAVFYKVVAPLARMYWGLRLAAYWTVFLLRGRLIRINRVMGRVR